MALYIQAKIGGGKDFQVPARAVPTDLNLLGPRDKAAADRLKKCMCKMSTSMQCKCGTALGLFGSKLSVSKRKNEPLFNDGSRWKMATIRRRIGNVTVDSDSVVRAVEEFGGLDCVDGKQGTKGKGWSAVAESIGINVARNRDAGYQIKKIYWLSTKRESLKTKPKKVAKEEW